MLDNVSVKLNIFCCDQLHSDFQIPNLFNHSIYLKEEHFCSSTSFGEFQILPVVILFVK